MRLRRRCEPPGGILERQHGQDLAHGDFTRVDACTNTTAVLNGGCVGAIVDGAIRDVGKIRQLEFPVVARGKSIYDSKN